MAKDRHQNYKKASNLIFITVVLGFIKIIFSQKEGVYEGTNEQMVESMTMIALWTLVFILGIGLLIRFGLCFVKFILPILPFFGLFGIPGAFINIKDQPITSLIQLVVFGFEIWAIVLLFRIPKASPSINTSPS